MQIINRSSSIYSYLKILFWWELDCIETSEWINEKCLSKINCDSKKKVLWTPNSCLLTTISPTFESTRQFQSLCISFSKFVSIIFRYAMYKSGDIVRISVWYIIRWSLYLEHVFSVYVVGQITHGHGYIRTYHRRCDIWREGNAKHCRCQRHTRCRIEQIRSGWTKRLAPAHPDAPPKHRQLREKSSSSANNTRMRTTLYLHHINYR